MTWEQTIEYIRAHPEYLELIETAYFDKNLALNVERFKASEEFIETVKIFSTYAPNAKTILDVGSGNGISPVSFSLEGFKVTACEPDQSNTIGSGAIRLLKQHYQLTNLNIKEDFAEEIDFGDLKFDIVYVRQAMHHAYNLPKFIVNLAKYLNAGGLFLTVRDHVIFDSNDKELFLKAHPLQKFYGGENAFTSLEYKNALEEGGLELIKELKYFDSPINYFPLSKSDIVSIYKRQFLGRFYYLRRIPLISTFLICLKNTDYGKSVWKKMERQRYGRMYSYICIKN